MARNSPVTSRYRAKLSYYDVVAPSITANLATDYKFNLNSLFDPDLTSTGHQPYGYDQLSAFYGRYVVKSVRYQLKLVVVAGVFGGVSVVPNNTGTSYGSADRNLAAESPLAQTIVGNSGSPNEQQVITGKVDLWKLTGQTLPQYLAAAQYWGTTGTSPTETLVLHVVSSGDATTSSGFVWSIKLEFDAEFFDPIDLSQS